MSVLGHELNRGIRSVFSNELQKRTPSQLLIVQMEDGGGALDVVWGGGLCQRFAAVSKQRREEHDPSGYLSGGLLPCGVIH